MQTTSCLSPNHLKSDLALLMSQLSVAEFASTLSPSIKQAELSQRASQLNFGAPPCEKQAASCAAYGCVPHLHRPWIMGTNSAMELYPKKGFVL